MTIDSSIISALTGRGHETAAGRTDAGSSSYQGASPAAVSGGVVELLLLEDAARELAAQLASITSPDDWASWRESHRATLAAVHLLLPECPAKRRLTAASGAAKAAFGRGRTPKKALTRGESRRSP